VKEQPAVNEGQDRLGADKIEEARGQQGHVEPAPKPSQAEGDPETVDAALRQKEAEGEL
jgi:hypothetical protein